MEPTECLLNKQDSYLSYQADFNPAIAVNVGQQFCSRCKGGRWWSQWYHPSPQLRRGRPILLQKLIPRLKAQGTKLVACILSLHYIAMAPENPLCCVRILRLDKLPLGKNGHQQRYFSELSNRLMLCATVRDMSSSPSFGCFVVWKFFPSSSLALRSHSTYGRSSHRRSSAQSAFCLSGWFILCKYNVTFPETRKTCMEIE